MTQSQKQARRVAVCGMLLALMLVLGFVESQIPIGSGAMPGVKLGLSNSVLIFAVYMLNVPTAFMLMALKVVLSAFLFSNLQALTFALSGGLLSMIVMTLLSRIKGVSPVVISMVGGLAHNVGQVAMAIWQTKTFGLLYYMAILMVVGMITGLATGVAANGIIRRFQKEKGKRV